MPPTISDKIQNVSDFLTLLNCVLFKIVLINIYLFLFLK